MCTFYIWRSVFVQVLSNMYCSSSPPWWERTQACAFDSALRQKFSHMAAISLLPVCLKLSIIYLMKWFVNTLYHVPTFYSELAFHRSWKLIQSRNPDQSFGDGGIGGLIWLVPILRANNLLHSDSGNLTLSLFVYIFHVKKYWEKNWKNQIQIQITICKAKDMIPTAFRPLTLAPKDHNLWYSQMHA